MKKTFLIFLLSLHATLSFAGSGSIYSLNQTWKNQGGKEITLKSLEGKPSVITMIFTSCAGACPLMISNMKKFDNELTKSEKKGIGYYAFSMDPKRDTPEILEKFKTKMDLDERWMLFTSNAGNARELSVALGFSYMMLESGDFTHSSTLYLISAKGEVLAKHEKKDDWTEFLTKYRNELVLTSKKK